MRRKRSSRATIGNAPGDHDGILDVLANLVGVLTLVGALSAVVAANAAVKIKTPMSRSTNQDFVLVVAGEKGIWNLQPAKEALLGAQEQRIAQMRSCFGYGLYAMSACFDRARYQMYTAKVGGARYLLNDSETSLQRVGAPDVPLNTEESNSNMKQLVESTQKNNKAFFVLLEKEGFESFRALRSAASAAGVDLGWEPWTTNGSVHFGGGGRSMTVQ